ncbi:MAG TPA: pilus assembly protein TadG-related protein [Vicinamibacterales bacterium]|nr:pilus assembly protein TadG-related protein [Vicinamibacterales bacterium]
MKRYQQRLGDESGMSYAFIGMGMMAFLSASMLAIDVGMLMTARNQAQNSADAGALAGATALVYDDWDDRSPSGPAVVSAMATSTANQVMSGDVSVTPDDVEFLTDEFGDPNRVRVTVHRQPGRGNPLSTLIAQYFNMPTAGVSAVAMAEASAANAMTCVKPFTIPDKWIEKQTAPWDGNDTYDAFDNKGNPLANPDIYIPADQPGYTGYNTERERGQRLMIRAGTGNDITVSFYFSLAIGGVTGGDEYEWNIENCNQSIMRWGELLVQEPGNMMGPTVHGIEALIAKDPTAYWDTGTNGVKGSTYPERKSPRIFPIPLYDPIYYDSGKRMGRTADLKVANWIGFFAEEVQGNNIWGRIIPIGGIRDKTTAMPDGLNPKTIRLVQ